MLNRIRVRPSIGRVGVRLWGPFIIGALVSLAVVVAIAIISATAQRQQVAAFQKEVGASVKAQLEQYIQSLRDEMISLAEVLPLIPDADAQRLLMKSTVEEVNSSIFQLCLLDPAGGDPIKAIRLRECSSQNQTLPIEVVTAIAKAGDVYFGPVYISDYSEPFMDVALPVGGEMDETSRVLRAEVDLTVVWDTVARASSSIGGRAAVYVVDARGDLVAFPDVSRMKSESERHVANRPHVMDALAAGSAFPAAREYASGLDGVPALIYSTPVDVGSSRWTVIIERPLSDAYAQINTFGLIGLALSAATLVSISFVGLYIRRNIARPIQALRDGAGALAAGDLNHRIHVDTGDEFEFLAKEFNEMSATLQQSQMRLATMARERERQAEDAQSRLREMTALIQSGRAITSLDLRDVLSRLSYEVTRAVQGDRCSIYVLDAKQRRLVLRGEWEVSPSDAQRPYDGSLDRPGAGALSNGAVAYELGEGIVGWVARENNPIFLATAQADKRFVGKAPNDMDIAALIGVPLHIDDEVVGVLQASTRPGTPAFDPGDQRLLTTFANQAAAAIRNSYLYETERRRAQEMSIVAEIIRTISASLDLDATLNSILSSVQRLIAYDLAEITLWDPDNEVLKTRGRGADAAYDAYSRSTGGCYRLDQGYTGWIARHRAPLLITDTLANREILPAIDLQQFPIRSHAGVPLVAANQLIGTLELAAYQPAAFNESHIETLRTIAGQAAVAIQNAQLYLESRRKAEELAGLFRVASVAASTREPDEILREIMAEASNLMGAQLGVVLLFDDHTQSLQAHRTALFGASYVEVADFTLDGRRPTFHHTVFRSGRVFRSDDALADRRILKDYRPLIQRFEARRVVSAPLVVRDRSIGEVHIARRGGDPFDIDDEQRLMTLATLLGGVVETAHLAAERGARIEELAGLYEISRAVSSLADVKELYAHVTRSIAERVGVEYAGVLLYDPGQQALVSQPPFYGVPDEVLQHYVIPVPPDSSASRIWSEGAYWISNDVQNDPLTVESGLSELAQSVGVKRTLFAPMTVGARRIGVVQVSNKRNDQLFSDADARLMAIYATQIATLVENARLYALTDVRLQQRVDELNALSSISQELNATLDLDRILDLVLDEAVRASGASRGSIVLSDPGAEFQTLRALRGYTTEEVERSRLIRLRIGDGVVGTVLQTGEPILVDDVRQRPDYIQMSAETMSELAVPIRYAMEVAGAINLESSRVGHFQLEHLTFLQALAAQAAIAIGNHQRYEEQLRRC